MQMRDKGKHCVDKECGPWPERPKEERCYGLIKRSRMWIYGRSEEQNLKLVSKDENLSRVESAEAKSRLTRRNVKRLLWRFALYLKTT